MVEFQTIEERVHAEREAARLRDEAWLRIQRVLRVVNAVAGAALGGIIAAIAKAQGTITVTAVVLIVVCSAALQLYASVARLEILKSLLLYPAAMVPLVITLRLKGAIACDDAVAFIMLLVILMGMSCSYACGWIRSQPGE
jgi:hypothetical protein